MTGIRSFQPCAGRGSGCPGVAPRSAGAFRSLGTVAALLASCTIAQGLEPPSPSPVSPAAHHDSVPADPRPGSAEDLAVQLAQLETQIAAGTTPDPEAAAQRADELRARLIELLPTDARVPTWLTDRASRVLAGLSVDDANTSAVLGMPTADQRSRVRDASRAALVLLDHAAETADRATAGLESAILDRSGSPDEIAARALQAEKDLHRLVDVEQTQRIPFLKAEARVLQAAVGDGEEGSAQASASAIQALRARTPALESAKDVLLVCAIIGSAPSLRDRAREVMTTKLRAVVSNTAADATTRRRARLAMIVLGIAEPTAAATTKWPDALAEAEAFSKRSVLAINPVSPARWQELDAAFAPLVALAHLPAPNPELELSRRSLVYAKIAGAIDARAPSMALSPETNLARAITMLRATSNPSIGAEQLLTDAAERPDASAEIRGDILWELGVALDRHANSPEDHARQVSTLARLISEQPNNSHARAAAEYLATHETPDWGCLSQTDRARAAKCPLPGAEFTKAIRFLSLAAHSGTEALRWKLETIRLQLWSSASGASPQALAGAIAAARSLPAGPEKDQAVRELVAAARAFAASAPPAGATGAAADGRSARVGALENICAFLKESGSPERVEITLDLAEAQLGAGRSEAAGTFKELIGSPIDIVASRASARIRLGLAQSLRSQGKSADAFGVLRELAEQFDKAPGERGRDEPFWAAWASMLEIRADSPDEGARDEVLTTIKGLELVDPELGGEKYAQRIHKVRDRLLH